MDVIYYLKRIYHFFYDLKKVRGKNNITKNLSSFRGGYKVIGDNNVIICDSAEIHDVKLLLLGNNNKIIIEENVIFKNGVLWIEDNNNEIIIKANTTIENAHIAVAEGTHILIGNDCMLSTNIRIATSDAHSVVELETRSRINRAKDIIIGNHVWIGNQVALSKGVTIGNNSIIASNTLVTHDVPDNSIAAGIPASIIKNNVSWQRERI